MKHFTHEYVLDYITNRLTESKRVEFEDHLYTCDQCLNIYTTIVEEQEDDPRLDGSQLAEQVLDQLTGQQKSFRGKNSFLQNAIFHYGVAAAVTIILMTSGVFQGIAGLLSTVEVTPIIQQDESVSKQLMNKALTFIEMIEPNQKEVKE